MCYDEIGLRAQNTHIILGSIVNTKGVVYVTVEEKEPLHFDHL